jgi:hypothetical protein
MSITSYNKMASLISQTNSECLKKNCKFYGYQQFKNYCSGCYFEKNPNEHKKFLIEKNITTDYYTISVLNDAISKVKIINSKSIYSKTFIYLFKNKLDFNFITLFEKIKQEGFVGFSCEFIVKLLDIFITNNHLDKNAIFNSMKYTYIQHLFSALIADHWNIKSDLLGSISVCYYGNFNDRNIKRKKDGSIVPIEYYLYSPLFKKHPNADDKRKISWWVDAFKQYKTNK